MPDDRSFFLRVVDRATGWLGSPAAVFAALAVVMVWAVTGPAFGFSDTWQLVINTGTTVVTFIMVFVIQASQNRDTRAMNAKLDALLEGVPEADARFAGIERLSAKEIEAERQQRLNGED